MSDLKIIKKIIELKGKIDCISTKKDFKLDFFIKFCEKNNLLLRYKIYGKFYVYDWKEFKKVKTKEDLNDVFLKIFFYRVKHLKQMYGVQEL
jgi:hypothetical protein